MSKKNQHVVPHGNQWAVKGEKTKRATSGAGKILALGYVVRCEDGEISK